MSSLAAAQADGYYRNEDGSKRGGNKGHNQYLKSGVIRFELPFHGFCVKCNSHMGKGVRFNAKKIDVSVLRVSWDTYWLAESPSHLFSLYHAIINRTQAGKYFSTKIYEFHMKCPTCANHLVIRTDPKNCDYDYVEGIKRREQEYDLEVGRYGRMCVHSSEMMHAPPFFA